MFLLFSLIICIVSPVVIAKTVDRKYTRCAPDHYGIDEGQGSGCEPCDCNAYGVAYKSTLNENRKRDRDMSCDQMTGQCNCAVIFNVSLREKYTQNKYDDRRCDGCPNLQYLDPDSRSCVDCNCHPEGSRNFQCDLYTGNCECNPMIVGQQCDTRGCEWERWSYGECVVTDFLRCRGTREKSRQQFPAGGGYFSTITKVADCAEVEVVTIPCKQRNCNDN
ncbi:laminin subunit alpha-1-like [Bolinopsis microptera]|uniref:laminin subunit alpha-1-like n=1 Tax=Bolinopsis microptera TaxID=2820187 RepID=UPI00307B0777